MKILFLIGLLSILGVAANSKTATGNSFSFEPARTISKLMKPAMEAKDAPATCWYLGQVRGFALAAQNAGNKKAESLVALVTDNVGKCGGKNSLNLSETFTSEEWKRLSELQRQIESYNE